MGTRTNIKQKVKVSSTFALQNSLVSSMIEDSKVVTQDKYIVLIP